MNRQEMNEWFGIIDRLIKRSAMDSSYKAFALEGLDYLRSKASDGAHTQPEG